MTFERGVWSEAVRSFWLNKWLVLLAIGLVSAANILELFTISLGRSGILIQLAWLPMVVAAHATVLNGETSLSTISGERFKTIFVQFLVSSIVLSLIGLIPAAAISVLLAGSAHATSFVYWLMISHITIESFVLAKWGTMLPASVAEGDKSFKAAGKRGSNTFGYVFVRLWLCNGLAMVGGLSALLVLYVLSLKILGESPSQIISTKLDAILQVFIVGVLAFNFTMLATILSRAYLIAEDKMKRASALASTD